MYPKLRVHSKNGSWEKVRIEGREKGEGQKLGYIMWVLIIFIHHKHERKKGKYDTMILLVLLL